MTMSMLFAWHRYSRLLLRGGAICQSQERLVVAIVPNRTEPFTATVPGRCVSVTVPYSRRESNVVVLTATVTMRPGLGTVRLRYSTVRLRYGTVRLRYSTVRLRYSTVRLRYSTVRLRYGTVRSRYSTVRFGTVLYVKKSIFLLLAFVIEPLLFYNITAFNLEIEFLSTHHFEQTRLA